MSTKLNREAQACFDLICVLPADQIRAIKKLLEDLGDELDFRAWMVQMDEHMGTLVPLTHKDLEDHPYRDWFDSGLPPHDVAIKALEDSGYTVENL